MSTDEHYDKDERRDDMPPLVGEKSVELSSLAKAKFATLTYDEVEAYGPAAAPIGFPAPRVVRSRLIPGLCRSSSLGKWSKQTVLVGHCDDHNIHIGYIMTPITLKHTLCGEIVKGLKVVQVASTVRDATCEHEQYRSTGDSAGNLWMQTGESVAIKVDRRAQIKRLHDRHSTVINPENPWKEVAALQLFGATHPNIISLLGAFVDDLNLYEVMPYYSGGSLSDYIQHHPNGILETRARHFVAQLILGLHHIHLHGVCHHDISADNIMLDENESKCVLIDFGMCLRVPHSYLDDSGATGDATDESMGTNRRLIHSHNHCGKLRFMAPEIYSAEYAFDGLAADIWSAGVLLFLLVTGRHPYERPDTKDSGYYDLVDDSFYWDGDKVNPLLSWGRHLSSDLVDLLKRILKPEPRERATLSQILSHRWFNSYG